MGEILKNQECYKRMSDESESQYIYRMCRNKDIGKYELTWEDLGKVLNKNLDSEYTESKYRKEYQAMQRGIDLVSDKMAKAEDVIEKMNITKTELEMKIKEVQTETIYKNRILREHSREEMLKNRVINAMNNVDKMPLPKFESIKTESGKHKYLLGISDVHSYKIFKSLKNEYSKEILEQRMAHLLSELIETVRDENISELTIVNGGDNLEGLLRSNGSLSALELGVVDTVVEYRRFIAKWITDLSKYVKIKYIHLTSANHTEVRLLNMRAGQNPIEDLEKDLANYIKDITENNERIEVIIPETSAYTFELCGYNFIAHHGHMIKSVKAFMNYMTRTKRVFYDYGVFGHLHTESIGTLDEGETNDCEILRLPSVMGSDKYADTIMKGSKASAVMFRFTENKGRDREYKFLLN